VIALTNIIKIATRMSNSLAQLLIVLSSLVYWSLQRNNEEVYKEVDRPSSCKEILDKYPATPSGYYYLKSIVTWILNIVVVRDGQEWLMLTCPTSYNRVLVTSTSSQVSYIKINVMIDGVPIWLFHMSK